jgi:anaerobic magnesium-protoporphyrin IX monomethyl ester cyclase
MVLFVNPPFKTEYGKFSRESRSPAIAKSGALYYPLWLLYAAGVAEKNGFAIGLIDAPAGRKDESATLREMKAKCPDTPELVVVNTSTPSFDSDVEFCANVKNTYPDTRIILVGTHPSAGPEAALIRNAALDYVAIGEYDYIIRDLLFALQNRADVATVKGLAYQQAGRVIINPAMPYIADLDELPFVSAVIHKHLDPRDYFFPAASYPSLQIFTGRGCPYHCFFCVYPQLMHGHKYRKRTPGNIVAEFEYIAANFPQIHEVVIEDDTFTANDASTIEFCKLLIERNLPSRLRWICNARVTLKFETMKWMKKAGCRLIIPGIESASQAILNHIKKGTTLEAIHAYVRNAKKAGLLIHACYMVGNPGETRETMEATLQLAIKLNTDTAQFFPLIPYPGTEAYRWALSHGYITGDHADYCKEDGTHNCVLNLPGLPAADLVDFCNYSRKRYYLRLSYIAHRLWTGLKHPSDLKRSLKAFKNIRHFLFHRYIK